MKTRLLLLRRAWSDWQGMLQGLLSPERKTPPGKLSLQDLKRLVKVRGEHDTCLLSMGEELLEYSPLLSKKCLAERLVGLAEQAGELRDFNVMVREVVALYNNLEEVASLAGLRADWYEASLEQVRGLHERLEKDMERVLNHGVMFKE